MLHIRFDFLGRFKFLRQAVACHVGLNWPGGVAVDWANEKGKPT
jgi:hypothetical protein